MRQGDERIERSESSGGGMICPLPYPLRFARLAPLPLRGLLSADKPAAVATDAIIPRRRPPNLEGQFSLISLA